MKRNRVAAAQIKIKRTPSDAADITLTLRTDLRIYDSGKALTEL
jgi:hypothetical protein